MILTGSGPGGSGISVLARVVGSLGLPITQATVTAIAWTLTDLTTGTVVATGTWTVSSAVYQALVQNDPRWTLDSPARPGSDGLSGYNLLGTIPASAFPVATPVVVPPGYPAPAPHQYQVDVRYTPAVGEQWVDTGYYTPNSLVYG